VTRRQLLLDIRPEEHPSLDNFVVGDNAELLSRLTGLADPGVFDQIYLWGPWAAAAAICCAARRQKLRRGNAR